MLPSTFGCDGCIQSKIQKKKLDVVPTLKEPPKRASSVLHLVPPSLAIGGFVIMFIFIDAFSRLLYGLLSKTKKAARRDEGVCVGQDYLGQRHQLSSRSDFYGKGTQHTRNKGRCPRPEYT